MITITERKTEQTDLRTGFVLHMVSLFVVASQEEIEKLKEDDFKTFIAEQRAEGRLLLPEAVRDHQELVEVKYTRKGFLIKCSVSVLPISSF